MSEKIKRALAGVFAGLMKMPPEELRAKCRARAGSDFALAVQPFIEGASMTTDNNRDELIALAKQLVTQPHVFVPYRAAVDLALAFLKADAEQADALIEALNGGLRETPEKT